MTIALAAEHSIDADPDDLLFDFAAFPDGRALAVVAGQVDGTYSLLRIGPDGIIRTRIDSTLIPDADERPRYFERAVMCPLGSGFALVSPRGTARWSSLDGQPTQFERTDPFPRNVHAHPVAIAAGGISDDPNAALVLLREPQLIPDVTRYALLRFDDASRRCNWEWLDRGGDPPALRPEDFPHPDQRRPILFHGEWRQNRLRLFAVGFNGNYERWGMDFSIHAEIRDGRAVDTWRSDEQCFGTYSSSGRYLILNPLRARGACRLFDLDTRELHTVTLPRGCARFLVADHQGQRFWLKPPRGQPLRFVACR